ncbi:ATP-binding cassette domain-containing protein [Isoalcanivorax indicus]|uniref:ATP-binding cassette domain-containing protein n=1 Tax=Isoalcanivorax indicus TaxID=2202653 RepID=UPI000DBA8C09|nr:ATP-binding cassette domain-containing protein [Isoalcanivorax indicus]
MAALFRFQDDSLYQGTHAVLTGLTLTLQPGEKVALLGPSGAGKSTLLAALRRQRPQQIAWCPQDGALVPMLSAFHNIYMGALPRHSSAYSLLNLLWPQPREREAIAALANQLGIAECLGTSIDRLSGGQAQRVALGRALYTRRTILLGDEPVSSVDEHQARRLLDLALSQHDSAVVALHDRSLALACFDRVLGLRDGVLALDAPATGLSLADLDALYA